MMKLEIKEVAGGVSINGEVFVTAAEAANRLGCQANHAAKLAASGRFAGAFRLGREWAIPERAVLAHKPLPGGRPKSCI